QNQQEFVETTTQHNEPSLPQTIQEPHITQNHQQFENQNQQTFVETTSQNDEFNPPQSTQESNTTRDQSQFE
ncbi:unnamed protein product, partial [Rotaria sp. Silwood1]